MPEGAEGEQPVDVDVATVADGNCGCNSCSIYLINSHKNDSLYKEIKEKEGKNLLRLMKIVEKNYRLPGLKMDTGSMFDRMEVFLEKLKEKFGDKNYLVSAQRILARAMRVQFEETVLGDPGNKISKAYKKSLCDGIDIFFDFFKDMNIKEIDDFEKSNFLKDGRYDYEIIKKKLLSVKGKKEFVEWYRNKGGYEACVKECAQSGKEITSDELAVLAGLYGINLTLDGLQIQGTTPLIDKKNRHLEGTIKYKSGHWSAKIKPVSLDDDFYNMMTEYNELNGVVKEGISEKNRKDFWGTLTEGILYRAGIIDKFGYIRTKPVVGPLIEPGATIPIITRNELSKLLLEQKERITERIKKFEQAYNTVDEVWQKPLKEPSEKINNLLGEKGELEVKELNEIVAKVNRYFWKEDQIKRKGHIKTELIGTIGGGNCGYDAFAIDLMDAHANNKLYEGITEAGEENLLKLMQIVNDHYPEQGFKMDPNSVANSMQDFLSKLKLKYGKENYLIAAQGMLARSLREHFKITVLDTPGSTISKAYKKSLFDGARHAFDFYMEVGEIALGDRYSSLTTKTKLAEMKREMNKKLEKIDNKIKKIDEQLKIIKEKPDKKQENELKNEKNRLQTQRAESRTSIKNINKEKFLDWYKEIGCQDQIKLNCNSGTEITGDELKVLGHLYRIGVKFLSKKSNTEMSQEISMEPVKNPHLEVTIKYEPGHWEAEIPKNGKLSQDFFSMMQRCRYRNNFHRARYKKVRTQLCKEGIINEHGTVMVRRNEQYEVNKKREQQRFSKLNKEFIEKRDDSELVSQIDRAYASADREWKLSQFELLTNKMNALSQKPKELENSDPDQMIIKMNTQPQFSKRKQVKSEAVIRMDTAMNEYKGQDNVNNFITYLQNTKGYEDTIVGNAKECFLVKNIKTLELTTAMMNLMLIAKRHKPNSLQFGSKSNYRYLARIKKNNPTLFKSICEAIHLKGMEGKIGDKLSFFRSKLVTRSKIQQALNTYIKEKHLSLDKNIKGNRSPKI